MKNHTSACWIVGVASTDSSLTYFSIDTANIYLTTRNSRKWTSIFGRSTKVSRRDTPKLDPVGQYVRSLTPFVLLYLKHKKQSRKVKKRNIKSHFSSTELRIYLNMFLIFTVYRLFTQALKFLTELPKDPKVTRGHNQQPSKTACRKLPWLFCHDSKQTASPLCFHSWVLSLLT